MNKIEAKTKGKDRFEIFCTIAFSAVLAVMFGAIFYINFNAGPSCYNSDMYADMNLAKLMWQEKTLFPESWVFGNQLSVVSTPVLAAIFYGITKNIITSMAIASSVMTVLVFISYCWMLKPFTKLYARLGSFAAMVAVVFVAGNPATDTNGAQLLFTMASYYACYLIAAFIVFGCYARLKLGVKTKSFVPVCIIGVLLSFGTGMQSLRQTAVMIIPLICCEIVLTFFDKFIKKEKLGKVNLYSAILVSVFSLANILGVAVAKILPINQNTIFGSTELYIGKDIINNIVGSGKKLMLLLSVYCDGHAFLKLYTLLVISFVVIITVLIIIKAVRNKEYSAVDILLFVMFASVLVIVVINAFTKLHIRSIYYFMTFPLFAICVCRVSEKISIVSTNKKLINILKYILLIIVSFSLVCASVIGVAIINIYQTKKNEICYEVSEFLESKNYSYAYSSFGDSGQTAVASNDTISEGSFLWYYSATPLKPTTYLQIPDIFEKEDSEHSVYLFKESEYESYAEDAAEYGVTFEILAEFGEDGDKLYVCKASAPICSIVAQSVAEAESQNTDNSQ